MGEFNEAQVAAIKHKKGPMLVLAGAGSGKTTVLTYRIKNLIMNREVNPKNILVLTFTKAAAKEMEERFHGMMPKRNQVTFGTFHSVFLRILVKHGGYSYKNIVSPRVQTDIIQRAATELDHYLGSGFQECMDKTKEIILNIELIKNHRIKDVKEISEKELELKNMSADTAWQFYQYYQNYMQQKHMIDFTDMLLLTYNLFKEKSDVLDYYRDLYRYIMVDEYQDTNPIQNDIIMLLAEPRNNLFCVGDDDQSVYGFRGAKPGIMMEFMKDYPKARQILLDVNYRSSGYIVKGALRVIGNNKIRFEKKIEAFRKPDETVHVQEVKDPVQEAEYVLERIREYREKGVSYTEMAVLYRTNVDARAMSELMTEYQIPFVMKEHLNNIYEHFIALDMISYLRLSQGEYDRKYFLQIANRPNRYLTRESMKTGNVSYESLRRYYRDKDWMVDRIDQLEWDMKMICDKTPYAAIQYIRKRMGYDEFLKEYAAYRKISSEDLFALLEEIWQNSKGYGTIKEWFEHIESYGKMLKEQNKKNGEKEGVNLMTMHAAKGLEFDTVFVIEANEGSCPYKKATADEEIEEERRLFYVAMTRAKRKLVISYVKEKNGKDLLPSRFVSELLLNV